MLERQAIGANTGSPAETQALQALVKEPCVVLRNFMVTSGRTVREIDMIVITVDGVSTWEVKGTKLKGEVILSLNGDWTIGGKVADFSGGPNPVPQARKGAQIAHQMLTDTSVGFIVPVVCIVGDDIRCPHWTLGDTLAGDPEGCLEGLKEAFTGPLLSAQTVLEILAMLDVKDVTLEDLLAEGFTLAEATGGRVSAKVRRTERKRAELAAAAEKSWITSNRRRVISGLLAAALTAGVIVLTMHLAAAAFGAFTFALVAGFDLFRRTQVDGPRTKGPLAVLGWLATLAPYAGLGVILGMLLFSNLTNTYQALFNLQLELLLGLALLACLFTGKSSFIHPPAMVAEKHDPAGKPMGVFYLVDATPKGRKLVWPSAFTDAVEDDLE